MREPVAHAIARAVVPGRHEDRHAQGAACEDCLVQRRDSLLRPGRLRRTPANRENRRPVRLVMDRGGDCIHETLLGVLREVDRQLRGWCDRPGDLDVEFHFTVWAVRVAGRVVPAASHGDRYHLRDCQAQAGEVGLEIGGPVTATELEDADGLATAVLAQREIVQACHLPSREGTRRPRRRPESFYHPTDTEVRPHLRPLVEPEYACDGRLQPSRNVDGTRSGPKDAVLGRVQREFYAEGGAHLRDCATENDCAARGVHADDSQAIVAGEASYRINIVGMRAIAPGKLGRRKMSPLLGRCRPQSLDMLGKARVTRPDENRYSNHFMRRWYANASCYREWSRTSRNGYVIRPYYHGFPPSRQG